MKRESKNGKIVEMLHLKVYPFTLIVLIRNNLAVAEFLVFRL